MEKDIIKRIAAHVISNNGSIEFPVASEEAIMDAEASLGLKIPTLLRSIYLNIGNGGFGPGYGIIGVSGGRASNLGTLVNTYDQMKNGANYLGLKWKNGLVPFCEWGCNIFTCVDCDATDQRVFQSEDCKARAQSYSLEDFFDMWLNGVSILDVDNSGGKTIEVINPFTRAKTHVTKTGKGEIGNGDRLIK